MWSESLIDLVKKQPMLYDRSNAGYKSVTKKKLKWKEISAEINDSLGIEITGEACEKKWRQLRDSFTREHKKLTSSTSLGSCSTKEWELYRAMYFLIDHLRYKSSGCSSYMDTSNCSIQNSSYSSEPLYVEEEIIVVNADEDVDNSNDNENYDSPEHSPQPAFSSLLPSHHSKATGSTISSASAFSTKRSPDCLSRDNFYKRQKSLDCLDEELKNSYEILTEAVGTLKGFTKPVEEVDGWLQCMKEAWKEVPVEKRNRCMVDILNIMDKYRNKKYK